MANLECLFQNIALLKFLNKGEMMRPFFIVKAIKDIKSSQMATGDNREVFLTDKVAPEYFEKYSWCKSLFNAKRFETAEEALEFTKGIEDHWYKTDNAVRRRSELYEIFGKSELDNFLTIIKVELNFTEVGQIFESEGLRIPNKDFEKFEKSEFERLKQKFGERNEKDT